MAGTGKPQLQEVYAALSILYNTQNRDKLGVEKASTYLSQIQHRFQFESVYIFTPTHIIVSSKMSGLS